MMTMIKLMADNLKCDMPDMAINSDFDCTHKEKMLRFMGYQNDRENGPILWNKNTNTTDEEKVGLMTLNEWYSSMGSWHWLLCLFFFCNVIIWLNDITIANKKYSKCFFHFLCEMQPKHRLMLLFYKIEIWSKWMAPVWWKEGRKKEIQRNNIKIIEFQLDLKVFVVYKRAMQSMKEFCMNSFHWKHAFVLLFICWSHHFCSIKP